jgi:putative toxin-antitoxin system antitoxin component (TIGR02293 family)
MASPAHDPTISEITQLATDVFEDAQYAFAWLSEPNTALGDKSPIETLNSEKGTEVVKNLLLRIRYGVLNRTTG